MNSWKQLTRFAFLGSLLVILANVTSAPGASGEEEFVGPLAGWKNVKKDYGAAGDGQTDDTSAIQRAFDDLRLHKDSCVLYFPAGKYRITDTVKTTRKAHTDCMGITVVGEDPATTVIRWDGKEGGTMLKYDAWYSKISRLTIDGAGKAGAALAYGDAFSTYNETSDMVFLDAKAGLSMGSSSSNGQAENAVLRCTFRRCVQGIQTNNFNSMDVWAWHCLFEDCDHGLYNNAGNFHAYQCLFLRSRKADIGTSNLMVFSFVGNTSIGSACFLDFTGGHSWGSPCSITGNRIVEPTGDSAIRLGNGGPYLVMDNAIKSRPEVTKPPVVMTWGDQALVGNLYTSAVPVKEAGRSRRFAEKVVAPEAIDGRVPQLPPTPPRVACEVLELTAGADSAAIQHAIDAARRSDKGCVVHLAMGTYKIDRTLVVPAGCNVRIVGDGGAETATVLQWTGKDSGPMFRFEGPSKATLRDLSLACGRASGIVIERCDQPGGKIFCDQLNVIGRGEKGGGNGVVVDGVETSDVLLRCVGGGTCQRWISVLGGALRQAGQPAPGQVLVLCGATGTSEVQYHVARGGRLVVRSVYHEVDGNSPQGILLDESGSLCVDATRFSYKTAPDKPLVQLRDFKGQFTLATSLLLPVGTEFPARINTIGDGSRCNVLCLGNLFWAPCKDVHSDMVWQDTSKPPAKAAMLVCNLNGNSKKTGLKNGFGQLDDRGQADDNWLGSMLQPLHEARIWHPVATPANVTDVRLYRVICTAGKEATCVTFLAR